SAPRIGTLGQRQQRHEDQENEQRSGERPSPCAAPGVCASRDQSASPAAERPGGQRQRRVYQGRDRVAGRVSDREVGVGGRSVVEQDASVRPLFGSLETRRQEGQAAQQLADADDVQKI